MVGNVGRSPLCLDRQSLLIQRNQPTSLSTTDSDCLFDLALVLHSSPATGGAVCLLEVELLGDFVSGIVSPAMIF